MTRKQMTVLFSAFTVFLYALSCLAVCFYSVQQMETYFDSSGYVAWLETSHSFEAERTIDAAVARYNEQWAMNTDAPGIAAVYDVHGNLINRTARYRYDAHADGGELIASDDGVTTYATNNRTTADIYAKMEDQLQSSSAYWVQNEADDAYDGDTIAFIRRADDDDSIQIQPYTGSFVKDNQQYVLIYLKGYDKRRAIFQWTNIEKTIESITLVFLPAYVILLTLFRRVYDKNERLEDSRRAFIGAAAHELKIPIAVVANNCECILDNVAPQNNDDYVRAIYRENGKMNELVQNLLEFHRLSTGNHIQKSPVRLRDVLQDESARYQALAADKNISLRIQCDRATTIDCDRRYISLVIDNFLSNAVRHTPENGEITLTEQRNGDGVTVTVHNTGSRIDEDDASRLWSALYRGDASRSESSRSGGMGLSICQKILEGHGFAYGCKNTETGVSFFFTARPDAASRRKKRESSVAPATKAKKRRLTPADILAIWQIAYAPVFLGVFGVVFNVVKNETIASILSEIGRYFAELEVPIFILFVFFCVLAAIDKKPAGKKALIIAGGIASAAMLISVLTLIIGLLLEY